MMLDFDVHRIGVVHQSLAHPLYLFIQHKLVSPARTCMAVPPN
jgi:hypothetical protein